MTPGAGIMLENVTEADSGIYSVHVDGTRPSRQTESAFTKISTLTVHISSMYYRPPILFYFIFIFFVCMCQL